MNNISVISNPSNKFWWRKYKNRGTSKTRLSFEMVLRKSFVDVAKEYVANSSIAGMKQIGEPNIGLKYRFTWLILFSTMVGITSYFLVYIWFGTLSKPLIVTMESSTYPISEIDFPAVAFCNINRISKKALNNFTWEVIESFNKQNDSFYKVEQFCLQLGRLIDYSWVENLRRHPYLDDLANNVEDTHIIIDVMKQLAPSCEEMLVKCMWAGKVVDCMSIFEVRRTVRGHCCAFNYILDYDSAGRPNQTLNLNRVKRQDSSGKLKGLNIMLDPMVDDYAYPLSNMVGFDVFLFDPTHFADISTGRVIHRIIEVNQRMILELQSVKQIATDEVRKYPLSTRKCLFKDEKKDLFGDMYSYSACIISCRIKTVRSLCKCTPYFLPTGKYDGRICTLDELRCLNKYKEKLLYIYPENPDNTEGLEMELQDSLNCPDCLPDCEFTQHYTKAAKIPMTMQVSQLREYSKKENVESYGQGINFTNKCLASIYQTTADGTLDRLDVINYWFEVLSTVGGFAGIFLGFSFISVVEIIYFFGIRLVMMVYINYKKYH